MMRLSALLNARLRTGAFLLLVLLLQGLSLIHISEPTRPTT